MMLLQVLHPYSVVSVEHGLTIQRWKKIFQLWQNNSNLPSGQRQFVPDCTGRYPMETLTWCRQRDKVTVTMASLWSRHTRRHSLQPCPWWFRLEIGCTLFRFPSCLTLSFPSPESADMEGCDFTHWCSSWYGVRKLPAYISELRSVTWEVLAPPIRMYYKYTTTETGMANALCWDYGSSTPFFSGPLVSPVLGKITEV